MYLYTVRSLVPKYLAMLLTGLGFACSICMSLSTLYILCWFIASRSYSPIQCMYHRYLDHPYLYN